MNSFQRTTPIFNLYPKSKFNVDDFQDYNNDIRCDFQDYIQVVL